VYGPIRLGLILDALGCASRYTYNLTHTLQHNMTRPTPPTPHKPSNGFDELDDKFLWNRHLLRPAFRGADQPSPFMLALIHGFVDQASEQMIDLPHLLCLLAAY